MSETDFETVEEASGPEMSRMNRYMVGDVLSYEDSSEWPPVYMEGTLESFANVEKTYLEVNFGDGDVKVLTEDDVKRVA